MIELFDSFLHRSTQENDPAARQAVTELEFVQDLMLSVPWQMGIAAPQEFHPPQPPDSRQQEQKPVQGETEFHHREPFPEKHTLTFFYHSYENIT